MTKKENCNDMHSFNRWWNIIVITVCAICNKKNILRKAIFSANIWSYKIKKYNSNTIMHLFFDSVNSFIGHCQWTSCGFKKIFHLPFPVENISRKGRIREMKHLREKRWRLFSEDYCIEVTQSTKATTFPTRWFPQNVAFSFRKNDRI